MGVEMSKIKNTSGRFSKKYTSFKQVAVMLGGLLVLTHYQNCAPSKTSSLNVPEGSNLNQTAGSNNGVSGDGHVDQIDPAYQGKLFFSQKSYDLKGATTASNQTLRLYSRASIPGAIHTLPPVKVDDGRLEDTIGVPPLKDEGVVQIPRAPGTEISDDDGYFFPSPHNVAATPGAIRTLPPVKVDDGRFEDTTGADVHGFCDWDQNGARLSWSLGINSNQVAKGYATCSKGEFRLNLDDLKGLPCGAEYQLVARLGAKAQADTLIHVLCQN
jgi:hypothetical protein